MNKKIVIISLSILVLLVVGISINKNQANSAASSVTQNTPTTNTVTSSAPMSVIPADKIEVVNFFGTQRCAACLTLGQFTKKTIEKKFDEEVKSGKVVFLEINGELPENRDIVIKYQARGSSLFINAIRGEKEDITEEVTVWRLINSESQFISYLEKKLNGLLGK